MCLSELVADQNPWWLDAARRPAVPARRRYLQERVLDQLLSADRRAVLVLGPRQVGKTVLLLQVAEDLFDREIPPKNVLYFDFSDDRLTRTIGPREVVEVAPLGVAEDVPRFFLFDEISRAPRWALWLKQSVDRRRDRIAATDSAASLLVGESRESGQGRWDEHWMEGLTFREFVHLQGTKNETLMDTLRRSPNLFERYLALGGFPEHVWSEDFAQVRRRLREDIVERAILRDLARLPIDLERARDLFVYLVQESGAIFDAAARARDLGDPEPPDPRSVRKWLQRLEETLLIQRLEPFHRRPAAGLRRRPRPKVYAADHGIVRAFAVSPSPDPRSDPRVLEAVVFRHLRELARDRGHELAYFRERDDLEIDFVVQQGRSVTALEVTSGRRLRREKVERFRTAGERLGADRSLLIHAAGVEAEGEEKAASTLLSVERFLLEPERWLE